MNQRKNSLDHISDSGAKLNEAYSLHCVSIKMYLKVHRDLFCIWPLSDFWNALEINIYVDQWDLCLNSLLCDSEFPRMAFDILAHSNIGDIIQKQMSLKHCPSLTLISSEYGTSWTWLISTILGAIIMMSIYLLAIIKSTSWLDSWCWGQCNSLFIAGHVTQYLRGRGGRERG